MPGKLSRYGGILLRGTLSEYAPGVFKGMLVEMLADVNVRGAAEWVQKDFVLWHKLEDKHRAQIKRINLRNVDWITADWVIDALRERRSDLASLFMKQNWKEAYNWLDRQVAIIRRELTNG